MEAVKTIKRTIRKWPVRSAALLTLLLIAVIVMGNFVFADGTDPIRTVHKVAAGDSTYCFSVQKNVVIPVSELAEIEDDGELTKAILERAGLFMQESECRTDEHPPITIDEWLKEGNTLSLSDEDLALVRQASPEEGKPVKLHLDLYFTLQADEDKANEEKAAEDEPSAPADPDPAEPGDETEPTDQTGKTGPGEQTATEEPADTEGSGNDAGTADTPGPSDPAEPSDPGEPTDPTEPTDPSEPTEPSEPEEPTEPSEPEEPTEPTEPTEPEEPSEPVEPEPYERPVYSTYKLTSPELLFIVIASDEDAKVPEDECEEKPAAPEMPEIPELPEIPEINIPDVPEDMLPEYRKIEMKDKSGGPLPATLEDGEPVELEWIEPQKGIDAETAKSWIEKYPGGLAGIGGTLAALGAGIGVAAYLVKKRRDDDD